jgi:hypothetical protein
VSCKAPVKVALDGAVILMGECQHYGISRQAFY